jgi:hypothetical protein
MEYTPGKDSCSIVTLGCDRPAATFCHCEPAGVEPKFFRVFCDILRCRICLLNRNRKLRLGRIGVLDENERRLRLTDKIPYQTIMGVGAA